MENITEITTVHLSAKPLENFNDFLKWFYLNLSPAAITCTDLNGEDSCVSHQERLDLEGLAEGSSLVHSTHSCCLIRIDVLPQLLSAQKNTALKLKVLWIQLAELKWVKSVIKVWYLEEWSSETQSSSNERGILVVDTYFPTALSSTSCTLGTRVEPPTKITCSISSCGQKYTSLDLQQ